MLAEKVKVFPVLYDKRVKSYKEKKLLKTPEKK